LILASEGNRTARRNVIRQLVLRHHDDPVCAKSYAIDADLSFQHVFDVSATDPNRVREQGLECVESVLSFSLRSFSQSQEFISPTAWAREVIAIGIGNSVLFRPEWGFAALCSPASVQGQRTLSRWYAKDFEKEVPAPSTVSAFHCKAGLQRVLLEQRQSEPPNPAFVLRSTAMTSS